MTETPATPSSADPRFPPGRYGRRRTPRSGHRAVAGAAALLTVIALALVSVRLYQQYGDPAFDPHLVRYTDISDTQVVITFQVHRPPGRAAMCAVRASTSDGAVIGTAEVPVPADRAEVVYRLVTTARPARPEVVRCWATP